MRWPLRLLVWCLAAASSVALPTHRLAAQDHEHPAGPDENVGRVEFANSCSPGVQADYQRAVAMLHSFRYQETEKAFKGVLARDSTCAIAAWGLASILMSNPLTGAGPPPAKAAQGQQAVALARSIGAKTERERMYVEAVAVYWEDWANRPERERQANRASAYEALAAQYPEDDEAQIFAALYIAGTQSLSDTSFAAYRRATAMLNAQLARHPDHPGVAHYLIHANDAPRLAAHGLPAARSYAGIAPDAPHALHMPSHIFTRVGMWRESAATNARSATAAGRDGEADEELHAMDYMVYAWLQLGRDEDSRAVAARAPALLPRSSQRFVAPYAAVAMPARIVLERGAWSEAKALVPTPSPYGFTTALTVYARALGAARSGVPVVTDREVAILVAIRDSLKAAKSEYWAGEVEVQRRSAAAWATLARGDTATALAEMRAAADQEDASEKHIVTPGRLLPARELLGDMLLAVGKPGDALREYELSQLREPNRFRGYAGAMEAAKRSGDAAAATRYAGKLVELAGDSSRPEVAAARKLVADRFQQRRGIAAVGLVAIAIASLPGP